MTEWPIELAGQSLLLHAERALWWEDQKALLVADVHLGKGNVLRNAGIALPSGQTLADLRRLDALIAHFQPRRLIVLGDLVHGPAALAAPWIGDVQAWRARHAGIDMVLVAGNHDRHFDASGLGFAIKAEPWLMPPFALCHAPRRIAGHYVLAGHVHPAITLRDGWRRHRVPAFRFDGETGVLPAFGALTGLHEELLRDEERIIAVTPAGLLPVARM